MCLAFPGKVIAINGPFAQVDFGEGTVREDINVSLVEVEVGKYVLVHAGYAIQVMNEDEARRTLQLWKEILAADPALSYFGEGG